MERVLEEGGEASSARVPLSGVGGSVDEEDGGRGVNRYPQELSRYIVSSKRLSRYIGRGETVIAI